MKRHKNNNRITIKRTMTEAIEAGVQVSVSIPVAVPVPVPVPVFTKETKTETEYTPETLKLINPKSELSYLEISQLRSVIKSASVAAEAAAAAAGIAASVSRGSKNAASVSTSAATTTETNKYFCNNCNRTNHVYNNCRAPITSIGVIAFRCGDTGPEFLMIRRRD